MKIRFTKKHLKNYRIYGILWLAIGVTAIFFAPENVFNYGYLIIGSLHCGKYLFENNKQYLTIENGTLTKHNLIPKKIKLDEIKRIKKFTGDYTLITESTQLKINTDLIEKNSLEELDHLLENLNVGAKQFGN